MDTKEAVFHAEVQKDIDTLREQGHLGCGHAHSGIGERTFDDGTYVLRCRYMYCYEQREFRPENYEDFMSPEKKQMRERFRRLHHAIEQHPYLSGLMTDEFQDYLSFIYSEGGFNGLGPYPGGETPEFDKEIGYDEDWEG